MNIKNFNSERNWIYFSAAIIIVSFFAGCSSAPKRTMMVTTEANSAYSLLEQANISVSRGEITDANKKIKDAYQKALAIDNADLLTKVCLTRVTLENAVGTPGENSASLILQEAKEYAARSSNPEQMLAICSLYEVRISLGELTSGIKTDKATMENDLAICNGLEKTLAKEKYYLAYLYRTKGELFILQQKYPEAQAQFVSAAELHTKERYLSEIGLDWYYAARACSLGGDKQTAIAYLQQALQYDRLAENTSGIGSDYLGLAKVIVKESPTAVEKAQAVKYAEYSAKIYKAGGFDELAQKSLEFILTVQ